MSFITGMLNTVLEALSESYPTFTGIMIVWYCVVDALTQFTIYYLYFSYSNSCESPVCGESDDKRHHSEASIPRDDFCYATYGA